MTPKRKLDPRMATALLMLAALSFVPALARAQEDQKPPEQQPGQNPPLPPPPDGPDGQTPQDDAGNPPEQAEATTGDAEILAQLKAIDENEVRAAAAAQQKRVTGPVSRFAKMLEQDHGKDIEDVQALTNTLGLTLSDNTTVDQLHAHAEESMTRLAPLTGDDYARGFVTEMVNGHREALQMIDDWLKTAQNDEVKQHLQAVRDKVAGHLREAEKLQGTLGKTERPASSDAREEQPLTS